jgi:hypothetical protein
MSRWRRERANLGKDQNSKRLLPRLVGGLLLTAALVAAGWWLVMYWTGNAGAEQRDAFAADRETQHVPFDAKRAMGYLQAICKIGPRISGTDGMKKQQELLEKHFTDLGGKVEYQRFSTRQKSQPRETEMANIIVSWFPEKEKRVILCSHYDTRPIADQEDQQRNWTRPFVSANDGASGVAILMELAHHMKDLKTNVGVDFVIFDGEEYIFDPRHPNGDEYFFGSKHFAAQYKKQKKIQYTGAILMDMTAGKNASFPIEQNSWWRAEKLVKEVWTIADGLGCKAFKSREFSKTPVEDDHIALNRAGIPAVDIIDFDYPHWHRLTDVPENCSAETMEQVARVLGVWLQRTR